MKSVFILLFLTFATKGFSQGFAYEYYVMNSVVDEFDIFGNDAYEMNLSLDQNINQKLKIEVGADAKADSTDGNNFRAANTIDGNMKTAWLTPDRGINTLLVFVIDLEEVKGINSATLFEIALFNGWRKDYQTWQDYSRIKKVLLVINDKPYAEVTLDDTYKMQYIDLEKMKLDKNRRYRFKLRIMETYPGKKFEQTGLSDVQFIGKAK